MPKRRNRQEWERAVSGFSKSKLSLEEYCGKRQLPVHRLQWWRCRLDREKRGAAQPEFVEVAIKQAPAPIVTSEPVPAIEIRIGLRATIRVSKGFDRATLVEVVSALLETPAC
jgi:hypothetical protein